MKGSAQERQQMVAVFRERLHSVIAGSGMSRSAFAASAGMDRSTMSQLLSQANDRLPRAESVVAIARAGKVSVDWLLGLSQEGQVGADVLAEALEIETAAASPSDSRLRRWQQEAVGYKIRYVPTTLPDLLKSEDVIRYEFRDFAGGAMRGRLEQAEYRLHYSRLPETDIEACSSLQSVEDFARGHGVWGRLSPGARQHQLETMIELLDELYPTFRWFLFDGLRSYSVPITIFGPLRAAVYVGNMYFVFNSTEHIRVLTANFDELIRAAVLQPLEVIERLRGLRDELSRGT